MKTESAARKFAGRKLAMLVAGLCLQFGQAHAGVGEVLEYTLGEQEESGEASLCAAIPASPLVPKPVGAPSACVTHWWICGYNDWSLTWKPGNNEEQFFTLYGESATLWGSATLACGPDLVVEVIGVEADLVTADGSPTNGHIQAEDHYSSFTGDYDDGYIEENNVPPCGAVSTHTAEFFNHTWAVAVGSGCAEERAGNAIEILGRIQ